MDGPLVAILCGLHLLNLLPRKEAEEAVLRGLLVCNGPLISIYDIMVLK